MTDFSFACDCTFGYTTIIYVDGVVISIAEPTVFVDSSIIEYSGCLGPKNTSCTCILAPCFLHTHHPSLIFFLNSRV